MLDAHDTEKQPMIPETLGLYLLSQSVNTDYDVFRNFVIAARSEAEARSYHPRGLRYEDFHKESLWTQRELKSEWVPDKDVTCRYIGRAAEDIECGTVITGDFHYA